MNTLTGVLIRCAVALAATAFGPISCAAEQLGVNASSGEVVAATEALRGFCQRWPRHPRCRHECGDGVVDRGEACDDGNRDDGDGCSAQCELDDVSSTPGDERAGYVICNQTAVDFTCGPDQGCCAQPNPTGPACAAERSECGQNPTFQECDGPEDCAVELHCVGTRFGNACESQGYYWVCHTDADCEPSRPECDAHGICTTAAECGDDVVDSEEDCDDGNLDAGDGCSPDCTQE